MSMKAADGSSNLTNEPNVTPMIDVLLVLLIIFMMVIPLSRRAIDLQLPDPNPQPTTATPSNQQIVLEVMPNEVYELNNRAITRAQVFNELKLVYEGRPEKILFIKGDPMVKYQEIIWAMDQARGAGVLVIGAAPKDPAGGS